MSTIIKDETLTAVAEAIREKTGKTEKMTPVEMATEIAEIPTGGADTLAEYLSNTTYDYAVPATVTQLTSKAFQNMSRLTKISFNGKTKAYNDGSLFSGCSSLVEADLSNLDCSNCTTLTYWFSSCNKLEKVALPKKVGEITNFSYMFNSCSNLTSIDLSNISTVNSTNFNNMFSSCSKLTEIDLSTFTFKTTGDVIRLNYWFYGCSSLKSLDLSKLNMSLVNYTARMFQNCTNLDLVTTYVNNSLKYVEDYCFHSCYALTLTKIGAAIQNIGASAFGNCGNIKTLWVPATCTSIGRNAFNGSGLTDFYTPLTEAPTGWNASAFPSTVTIHYGVSEEEYDKIIGETA